MDPLRDIDSEEAYREFLEFCSEALAKEDPKLLAVIKSRYENCIEDFRHSKQMVRLLKDTQRNMQNEQKRMFVHLKDLVTELKARSVSSHQKKHKEERKKHPSAELDPVQLKPCCVLITKAEEAISNVYPSTLKTCHIGTGLTDSIEEIIIASEEQQVSVMTELGFYQTNCPLSNSCSDGRMLRSPHCGVKQQASFVSSCDGDCVPSEGSFSDKKLDNILTPVKISPCQRKWTTVVNVSLSQSPEKIVSSDLIARLSNSEGSCGSLAIRGSRNIIGNKKCSAIKDSDSEENLPLGKNVHCSNVEPKMCDNSITSDIEQNKSKLFNCEISDKLVVTCSNDSTISFFQRLETEGASREHFHKSDSSLSDSNLENKVMPNDASCPTVDCSTPTIPELVQTSYASPLTHVCAKEPVLVLTDFKQLSLHKDKNKPKDIKRVILKTVEDSCVNKKFSSFLEPAKRPKLVLSTSADEFQEVKETNKDTLPMSRTEKHVRKLENLLEFLRNEIEKCQTQELTLDDMDDETSVFIYEDRLKKKFVAAWNKLCEITGRPSSTGRPSERTIKFIGTRYKEINRRLERFLNKRKIFPDFSDVRNIVKLTNKKYNLNLSNTIIDNVSREAFVDIGEMLQTRRHEDFIATFGTRQTDMLRASTDGPDPYLTDPEIRRKLDSNRKVAKSNLNDMIEKYSRLQDERHNDSEDDSEEEEGGGSLKVQPTKRPKSPFYESGNDNGPSELSNSSIVIPKKPLLIPINSHEGTKPMDLQHSPDKEDDIQIKSFAKALGLNPLLETKHSDITLLSSPNTRETARHTSVVEDSTAKPSDHLTAVKVDPSIDSVLTRKGPNVKFTARKPLESSSMFSNMSRPELACIESIEDEEDQSSESESNSDNDGAEDDDDDIMIIEECSSDSDSSRCASPISIISLDSSDDDSDATKDWSQLKDIKFPLPIIKQEITASISHALDLASCSIVSPHNNLKKHSKAEKHPSCSTEFLDLAVREKPSKNRQSVTEADKKVLFSEKFITGTTSTDEVTSVADYMSNSTIIIDSDKVSSPASVLDDDCQDFESADRIEVTIEIDDVCNDSGLPMAAENDMYISHQKSLEDQKEAIVMGMTDQVEVSKVDVSAISVNVMSNTVNMPSAQEPKKGFIEINSVIVIDESSQPTSDVLLEAGGCVPAPQNVATKEVMEVYASNEEAPEYHAELTKSLGQIVEINDSILEDDGTKVNSQLESLSVQEITCQEDKIPDGHDISETVADRQQSTVSSAVTEVHKATENLVSSSKNLLEISQTLEKLTEVIKGADLMIETFDSAESMPSISWESSTDESNIQMTSDDQIEVSEVDEKYSDHNISIESNSDEMVDKLKDETTIVQSVTGVVLEKRETLLTAEITDTSLPNAKIIDDSCPVSSDITDKSPPLSTEATNETQQMNAEMLKIQPVDAEMFNEPQQKNDTAHPVNAEVSDKSQTSTAVFPELIDDELGDVFTSITRICDEILHNSEKEESKSVDDSLVQNLSNKNSQESCQSSDTKVLASNNKMTLTQSISNSAHQEKKNSDVETSVVNISKGDIEKNSEKAALSQSSGCGENTQAVNNGSPEVGDKLVSEVLTVDKAGNGEDDVEIIEELSNVRGQRQCVRSKEEDRQWINEQLSKITNSRTKGAGPSEGCTPDNVKALISETSPVINETEEKKSISDNVQNSDTIPVLDMEVECVDNDSVFKEDLEMEVDCEDEPSETSSGSNIKRKRHPTEETKDSTSEKEPPAKKKHFDSDFITDLISSVYNEFPPGKLFKKPPPSKSSDQDEDILVVAAHFKPKVKPVMAAPQRQAAASRGTSYPLPKNMWNGNPVFPSSSVRSPIRNNVNHQPLARLNTQRTSFSPGLRQPNLSPRLGPRVPYPRISSPIINGRMKQPSTSFQNSQQNTFFNRNSGMTCNNKRNITSVNRFPSAPPLAAKSSFPQTTSFPSNKLPQASRAQQSRVTQTAASKNSLLAAKKLDGMEIVLDDSDSEERPSEPKKLPIILSVTSLSSASSNKKSSKSKLGDVIVLSDSD